MITDEQVNVACNRINERHSYTVASKKAMREVLETFEQSKWVRFDVDDVSTHPENGKYALVKIDKTFLDELGYLDTTYVGEFFNGGFDIYIADECGCAVTHWQPLPEFKE